MVAKKALELAKINQNIVESDIDLENQFEEDVLHYMPAIREIIKSGQDIDESFISLSNTLDISVPRFTKIYTAAKKELQAQTELRGGPDLRLELLTDIERKLLAIRRERDDFILSRKQALEKNKRISKDKKSKEELEPEEAALVFMKAVDYYKALNNFDITILKFEERRAKLAGVEVQRKEVTKKEANSLMIQLFGQVDAKPDQTSNQIIEAQWREVNSSPLESIKEDYDSETTT